MISNGYKQYKNNSVGTMTKGEILIRLYEEANKKLLKGKKFFECDNFEEFEEHMQGAINIVKTLSDNLDGKYSVSVELYRIYDFIIYELNRMKVGRKIEQLDDISGLIKELRDTFELAEKKVKKSNPAKTGFVQQKSVSIGIG